MASLGYVKALRRWRVRWRATNRKTKQILSGSKVFLEKSQAVKFYADREEEEKLWRYADVVPSESLTEVTDDFYRHIKKHTPRTQVHYEFVIYRFIKGLPKTVLRIQHLEPYHIREYLYRKRDAGFKNRTLNAHLTAIKSFCRFFSDRYKISNPAGEVKMLEEDPPKARFLEPNEYEQLLDMAEPLARDRIIFLANTGLRASEFASLSPDSLSPQASAITITGKGRKRRTIPLNKSAKEVLPRLVTATPNAQWLQFSRLAKRAKLKSFGPHSLRHFFATQLLLKGKPLILVSKLLGHKSTSTTERCYAHILASDLAGSTDVLD